MEDLSADIGYFYSVCSLLQ